MKKFIYITTTYIVLFTSLEVTYGKRIETEKKNHDAQLNNFYLYHNLKGIDFNNSSSSNEKQYNNKNNAINDKKFIQPHSITYFGNQKDTINDEITLYNNHTNKNDFDTFKSFNNDNEKSNRKETIVKSSFIQKPIAPPFDPSLYNIIDIIYGTSYANESLEFFYAKLRISYDLRTIDSSGYYSSKDLLDSTLNKLKQIEYDIIKIKKECEPRRTNVIDEMVKFHDPLYEFYKEPINAYNNSYEFVKRDYVNCMLPRFKNLETRLDAILSSLKPEFDYVFYYSYWDIDGSYKQYAIDTKKLIDSQLNTLKKYPIVNDKRTVPHIKSLIKILETEGENQRLKSKLFFLERQFEEAIQKSSMYLEKCKSSELLMIDYLEDSKKTHYYYELLDKITLIANRRGIFMFNSNNLKSLDTVYKYQKEALDRFVKTLGKLLIQKPDPNNNQIFKDDFDEFDKPIPKSNLTALETKFIEIFKQKWDSYDHEKTLGKNGNQDNNVNLILRRMAEFKDLIDTMEVYKTKDIRSKEQILSKIDENLNKKTYKEIENGLKESYLLAKDWKRVKRQIKTLLEEDTEKAIQLEKEINDLFKKYLEINGEAIRLNTLKFELKEKIKNISDKNEYVKKAIDLKKVVENNNAYIDELAKISPYHVTEYVNKKDKIYSTINSELSKIYKDDLDALYNQLSSVVKENAIDNTEDKTELEDLKSKIYEEYNKIQNMETEAVKLNLITIENKKNELSSTIVEMKKHIYKELNNELNTIVENFKSKKKQLSSNINDYSNYKNELNKYKSKISEIKNQYNDQSNIDNIKEDEAKQNYEKSKEYVTTISDKEDEIFKTINEMKHMKGDILNKVNVFADLENNNKEKINPEHESFAELVNKIKNEISDDQLNDYEKKFNDSKSLINETKKSIEEEYQNMNILKKVNGYLKVCKNTTESIEKFRNKKNKLNEILNKNIKTIKNCSLIEKTYTDNFDNTLTDKKTELEKTFTELSLSNYETSNNELIKYFNDLKKNLGTPKGNTLYQQLAENEKATNDIEQKNINANKNISNIEMVIHTSIYNISDEIEKLIGKNIELLNKDILKKAEISITNFNEIKEKLKHYNFDDFAKEENIKYADEINKIKNDINTLDQKVDKNIKKLKDIKNQSEKYAGEAKTQISDLEDVINNIISNDDVMKIENKQESLVKKIDKRKNIYNNMNKLLNEIAEIEKDKTSLEEVKNINLAYEKSLNKLFLDQIDKEKEKSKNMIKSIEQCKKDFDDIKNKQNIAEAQTLDSQYSKFNELHTISQDNEKYFSDIREKSLKLIEGTYEESNINDIKTKLQKHLLDVQKHNSDINLYLSEITNLYNIFKLNNIQNIIDEVKGYTKKIEEYNKNVKLELDKSETLIKTVKEKSDLETCKSKIGSTIDKDVDECIKKITESKNYILSEESNNDTYFKNAKEHNENVSLLFKNIEMANNKAQHILETKKDSNISDKDDNINELKENMDKSKNYKDESDKNAKKAEENKNLFEQHKKEVIELLNKYSQLATKNNVTQTKKDSNTIISEIKELHKQITLQAKESEQKINNIKEEKFNIEDDNANNNKSNQAAIGIQTSLENLENKLLKITNIKRKTNDYLTETESIEKQISSFSINNQDTELSSLQTFLESLKDQKKYIEGQKKELDNLDSEIKSIENDVDQHKKNYEIGIIEKIKETAITNKGELESSKTSIEAIIKNIISSFNTNDLDGINANENLEKYNTGMNNIYNEFINSYNLIINYSEAASKEPITYDKIKNTRITAQNELLKIIESKKNSKSYLDNVKIKEVDRIITHFKNKLDNVNDKFTNEYSNINKGLEDISKSIENVKNSTDENSLFDILKQTKNTYMGMIGKTYYSYKDEAENIFKNMVKLAYSLNIQIQNNSGINLFDNVNIAVLSSLSSETKDTLKFIPPSQNEPEIYTKIRNSYDTLLDIFKKSRDTHKKEQDTLNIMNKNQHLYEKIHASNELKGALSDTKYKKEKILNDVKLVLHKFDELNQLTCDSQNYDTILELSNQNQIKTQIDNYEQEKRKFGMDFNVATVEEKLDNIIKSIEKLENGHHSSEKKDSNIQYNSQLNEMTELFNTEIKIIENKIIEKNSLIDKLTKMRKECLLFSYTTLVATLKSKVINYSEFITSATKFSKKYLEYINNRTDSLNDDIDELQTKYNLNQTKKHMVSNITHITNDKNNLIEKEKEATQTINNLTKLFKINFSNADANILYYNKLQITYFYSQLQKSIESIKQLYRKIRAFKLSNIYLINEKYSDISKQFDNILQLQKNKLTENLNNLKEIEQYVSDKKITFLHTVNGNTNSNFNALKEIYDNIINRENKAHDIENINNKENENIILYTNTITKLTEKIQDILNFVTTHENDNNIIKQHIQDIDENDVSKIKEILKSTIQSFQQIQNKINEIKAQFYGNSNINSIIITISQNANDVKTLFTKDLTIERELTQIQNRLENIKNAAHENRSEQIAKYVNTIHNYAEHQFTKIKNNPNKDEIWNTMEIIRNYNKESEVKLQQISNYKNEVVSIIAQTTKLIALIKSKYGNNNISYTIAVKHEKNAQYMLNDLNKSQNILRQSINQNKKSIEDLGYRWHGIHNNNNLHTINKHQEISQIKYPKNTYHNNNDNPKYKNYNHSNSDKKGSSKTKSSGDSIKYAGAIAFGLVACYAITNFKKTNDANEADLDNNDFYNEAEAKYFERDDEVIEINMNEEY